MAETVTIIASNRRARREYEFLGRLEAGLALQGTEVKALREGKASLADAFCKVDRGEAYLFSAHIAPYSHASYENHDPLRPRKLLLHKREILRIKKATEQKGFTVIPTKLYFRKGIAKVEIAIARGKHVRDKRATIAERDNKRRVDRMLKQY